MIETIQNVHTLETLKQQQANILCQISFAFPSFFGEVLVTSPQRTSRAKQKGKTGPSVPALTYLINRQILSENPGNFLPETHSVVESMLGFFRLYVNNICWCIQLCLASIASLS